MVDSWHCLLVFLILPSRISRPPAGSFRCKALGPNTALFIGEAQLLVGREDLREASPENVVYESVRCGRCLWSSAGCRRAFGCSGIGGLSDTLSKCWAACVCFPLKILKVNLSCCKSPVKLQERSHAWRSFAALDDLDANLCTPHSMKPAREDMVSAISCIFQLRCPRFSVAMAWRREKQTGTLSKVAGQQLNYQCSANSDSRHF